MVLEEILASNFLGNTVKEYAIAALFFIASFGLLKLFKYIIIGWLKRLAHKTKTDIDDAIVEAIDKIRWPFYAILSIYIAFLQLTLPEWLSTGMLFLLVLVLTYDVAKIVSHIIKYSAKKVNKRKGKNAEEHSSIIIFFSGAAQVIVWIVALILLLDNIGVEVTTLLAGVGVGGIAVAFALQNVLADLFASISIYFDKPFEVGDFIIIGKDMGVVERIGLKTSRIRTLQGQELVISNKELTETRVNNYKKMEKRRVAFGLGVTYDTTPAKLRKIPPMIKKIIKEQKGTEFDRAHFKEFGDSSLAYEVVYYLDTNDYNTYMDIQQKINLGITEGFADEGIEFAYPTQTLYLKKEQFEEAKKASKPAAKKNVAKKNVAKKKSKSKTAAKKTTRKKK